jgi:hypothetical protein
MLYEGADNSLARPTSQCILFDGETILFDASLVMYITSTNIPPIMIISRIFEHQNLLSLYLVSFLVGLRTYQHPCNNHHVKFITSVHHTVQPPLILCRFWRLKILRISSPEGTTCSYDSF